METMVDFEVFGDGSVALYVAGARVDEGGVEADMDLVDNTSLLIDDLRYALENSEVTPAGCWHQSGEPEVIDGVLRGRFYVVTD